MKSFAVTMGQAAYLMLPCLGGAVVSGIVLRQGAWRGLARPIDRGLMVRGRRLFGGNKTWRGLACNVIGCTVVVAAQKYVMGGRAGDLAVVDYGSVNVLAFGIAFGVGVIAGELPNSFFKRQLGIPPGRKARGLPGVLFHTLDQVDFLLLTWPLLLFWIAPRGSLVVASFVTVFVVHQLVSVVGYGIGARETVR